MGNCFYNSQALGKTLFHFHEITVCSAEKMLQGFFTASTQDNKPFEDMP